VSAPQRHDPDDPPPGPAFRSLALSRVIP